MDAELKNAPTLKDIREQNTGNILRSLLRSRELVRNALAAENQISTMTVKHIVDDLLAAEVVVERTGEGGEVGRKPRVLQISEKYGHIICLNLTSAGQIAVLIYDIYETLLAREVLPFAPGRSYGENLAAALEQVSALSAARGTALVGLAAFVPSAYYEKEDLVNYDLIEGFKELHIRALLEETFRISNVLVLHDVLPAAWSEYSGLDPSRDSQFYFYCGYGVGGFFIHKNTAVMGDELMAGEVGKMILDVAPDGKFITVEDRIALPSLLRAWGRPEAGFAALLEAYRSGEASAKAVLDPALELTARLLYNLLWVYNPTRLVVDSCERDYSALIAGHMGRLLAAAHSEAIPIRVDLRQAHYDEYHQMRGCFHMARERWIEELASPKGRVSG